MANEKTPVVWDDTAKKHRPLGSGEKMGGLDASSLLSSDSGNLLEAGSDGLAYVSGSGISGSGADNLIGVDGRGRLQLTAARLAEWLAGHPQDAAAIAAEIPVVSEDSGNIVSSGSDGGAFLDAGGAAAALDGADLGGARAAAAGTDVLRSFSDRFGDVVNVRDFGAAGDGSTDDTAAIQAALDAGAGGTVFIPKGVYAVSQTLIAHAGTHVVGAGRTDFWNSAYEATGTVLKTTGQGNGAQWTDIDGEDGDETPLLVAGGNGVYFDDLTLYTDETGTPWSIGLFYPAVRQCGFHRIGAYGFTNAPIYLDCSWGTGVSDLVLAHPSITSGDGMNEFYGEDFFARAAKTSVPNKGSDEIGNKECFGIKVKGTTRDPSLYPGNNWLWSPGGASDIVFSKGRTTGILIDGAMNNGVGAIQGIRFMETDIRMRNGCGYGYGIYLNRCNRISFIGGYSEVANTPSRNGRGYANFSTTNTYLVSFVDTEYNFYASIDEVASEKRLNKGVPSVFDGTYYKPSVFVSTKTSHITALELKSPYNQLSLRQIFIDDEDDTEEEEDITDVSIKRNDYLRFNRDLNSATFGEDLTSILFYGTLRSKEDGISNLGSSNYKFNTLYVNSVGTDGSKVTNGYFENIVSNSGSASDSDERLKENIAAPSEALMRAWGKVNFKIFQFKEALQKKGADARIHVGVIAQKVIEAFKSEGLDAFRYGLLCYDKWDDKYEDELVDVSNNSGSVRSMIEKKKVQSAGDRYSIRYTEALALECAYQRWLGEQRDARIAALEHRLGSA